MIRYNLLSINRVIMHRIAAKTAVNQQATVECTDSLVALDRYICELLKQRLVDSFGRQGKSFELIIEDDQQGSCFDLVKDLSSFSEDRFIEQSKCIAQLLAESQSKKASIPGGYFLLVHAQNNNGNPVYIILKAETHNALCVVGNSIRAFQDIFLSPAQKLYKAGIFEQIGNSSPLTVADFKAYLFDSQFNDGTKLAEYFYKDFLGLTIDGNSKVQTKDFYDRMIALIDSEFKNNLDNRNSCRQLLQSEMTNQIATINPTQIINRIIPLEKRDKFIAKVGGCLPNTANKDISLIRNKLEHCSMLLTDSIRLYAPSAYFTNDSITIAPDPHDSTVKVIRIRT